MLHPSIRLLQNNAEQLPDGTVVIGTRLWDPPDAPWADPNAATVFARELERLKLSIAARPEGSAAAFQVVAACDRARALPAALQRWSRDRRGAVAQGGPGAGVRVRPPARQGPEVRFPGLADGIRYYLASVDAIDFRPIPIELP